MTTQKTYSEKLLEDGLPLENWSEKHVNEFLFECGFSEAIASTFLKEEISGVLIQQLNEQILRESLKISKLSDRLMLLVVFQLLKQHKNIYTRSVVRKIRDIVTKRAREALTESERVTAVFNKLLKLYPSEKEATLKEFAESYSSKDTIIAQYLDPGLQKIKESMKEDMDRLRTKLKINTNTASPTGTSSNTLKTEDVEDDEDVILPTSSKKKKKASSSSSSSSATTVSTESQEPQSEEAAEYYALQDALKSLQNMKLSKTVKVKLVFVETAHNITEHLVRSLTSSVFSMLKTGPKYGIIHSALIVGPWYLEWNSSGVVRPRPCVSNAAVFAMDVENNLAELPLGEVIQKVARVVEDWNTTKQYDKFTCNCQDFVDDLCQELGIDIKFSGPAKAFVDRLRKKGDCKIRYKPSAIVKSKFKLDTKYVFKTHKELDKFYEKIVKQDPSFPTNYPEDYMMLKAFDRAFWLRYLKNNSAHDAQPENPCPFGDPRASSLVSW